MQRNWGYMLIQMKRSVAENFIVSKRNVDDSGNVDKGYDSDETIQCELEEGDNIFVTIVEDIFEKEDSSFNVEIEENEIKEVERDEVKE